MKRRKIMEFAVWLSNSRHHFDMNSACDCVSGQCARYLSPRGQRGQAIDGDTSTLMRAFGLSSYQANDIYGGPGWLNGKYGRLVAVRMLRHLAKYGKVDWLRARDFVRREHPKLKATDHVA